MSNHLRSSPDALLARFLSGEPPVTAAEAAELEHAIRAQSWEGLVDHKHAARIASESKAGDKHRAHGSAIAPGRRWWFVGKGVRP